MEDMNRIEKPSSLFFLLQESKELLEVTCFYSQASYQKKHYEHKYWRKRVASSYKQIKKTMTPANKKESWFRPLQQRTKNAKLLKRAHHKFWFSAMK